jgi:hypothetical protein
LVETAIEVFQAGQGADVQPVQVVAVAVKVGDAAGGGWVGIAGARPKADVKALGDVCL